MNDSKRFEIKNQKKQKIKRVRRSEDCVVLRCSYQEASIRVLAAASTSLCLDTNAVSFSGLKLQATVLAIRTQNWVPCIQLCGCNTCNAFSETQENYASDMDLPFSWANE